MTITSTRRLVGLLALVAASALLVLLTAAAGPAAARARARPRARTCDITAVSGSLGPTAVTSLKVTGTSCETGKRVVRAFHACRLANGPSGRCVRLVQGFGCGEIRSNGPTQFTATATCRKRSIVVVHRYTQTIA